MLFASALKNHGARTAGPEASSPDKSRLTTIQEAYGAALANLDREIALVEKKYGRLVDIASLSIGNVDASLEPREDEDERRLRSAEAAMIATANRLKELRLQRDVLAGLRAQFEAATGALGRSAVSSPGNPLPPETPERS